MEGMEENQNLFQNVMVIYHVSSFNKMFRSIIRETVIKIIPGNSELGGQGEGDVQSQTKAYEKDTEQ